jgi:predicted DNA-binding transcriptional regulator AlpA
MVQKNVTPLDGLMSAADVSEYLDVPVATLHGWRHRGEGPPAMRVGRWLRYRESDVKAWIDQRAERGPHREPAPTYEQVAPPVKKRTTRTSKPAKTAGRKTPA